MFGKVQVSPSNYKCCGLSAAVASIVSELFKVHVTAIRSAGLLIAAPSRERRKIDENNIMRS